MLERLDSIDWDSLRHAYGRASDVPALIRSLLAEAATDRDDALQGLYDRVCHQGTVYDATAHVVPFLIELLESGHLPDKDGVATLLASIAGGTGFYTVHAQKENTRTRWEELLSKDGRSLNEVIKEETGTIAAVRREVASGLHLLIPYLEHPEPEVRMMVASALAHYDEQAGILLQPLRSAIEAESDEEVGDVMRRSIEALSSALR